MRKLTLLQRLGVTVAVVVVLVVRRSVDLCGDLKAAERPAGEAVEIFLFARLGVLEVLRRGERRGAARGRVLGVLGSPWGPRRGETRFVVVGPGVRLIP